MKKIVLLLLALVICLPVGALAGCKDPRDAKMEELDKTYVELGKQYTEAVYVCSLAGVYGENGPEDLNAKFAEWKTKIQDAGDKIDLKLDYDEAEMDTYIAEWKAIIDEINAVIAQYKVETTAEATVEETTEQP